MLIKKRHLAARVKQALASWPIVIIEGPRQCGKTTLVQSLSSKRSYISFDDPGVQKSALADPTGFVKALPEYVVLDEVQKVASLFSTIKLNVDNNRRPGRFLMTGSMNLLQLKQTSDSLAGRACYLRLHPLSQAEMEEKPSNFIEQLFSPNFAHQSLPDDKKILSARLSAGGYPPAYLRHGSARIDWHKNYVEGLVHHDLPNVTRIRSLEILPMLLNMAAARTAQLLNINSLASEFQISHNTLRDYLILLENVFLIERLPPWQPFSRRYRRAVQAPKLHLTDPGLACSLLQLEHQHLREAGPLYGQLLESFVLQELRRLSSADENVYTFNHYRDKDGYEVDITLSQGPFVLAGVEVKASSSVRMSDFKGLKKLQSLAGSHFKAGVVLYTGHNQLSFGDKLYALPIQSLWRNAVTL